MFIEKSSEDIDILGQLLAESGENRYEMIPAGSVAAALELLTVHPFDIILIDSASTSVKEIELLRKLKSGYPEIPILLLTGFENEDFILNAGFLDIRSYIYKHTLKARLLVKFLDNAAETQKMLNELGRKEAELEESEVRFRTMIEKNIYGIVILDPDRKILYINPTGLRLLGIAEGGAAEGYVFPEIMPGLDDELLLKTDTVKIPLKRQDSTRHLEIHTVQIPWKDGNASFVMFRDISDKVESERKLKQTLEDLARSNKDLEQFAYAVSHDLCEPLRSITGFMQLLEKNYKGRLDEKADHYISRASGAAIRMQKMITCVLEYSRLSTKPGELAEVDCNEIMEHVAANLHASIQESGATVTFDRMPKIRADYLQLTRVFQNLVANAIKYRGDAPLKIHVGVITGDDSHEFYVKDNGMGIEPKYFERIFILFQRLQMRSDTGGYGVGLAMCKKIVERHGGRIWVESAPGKGSVFRFTIPIRKENGI